MSIDETLLMCVVSSLFDLGAYLEQRTSFDKIPAGSRLRGAARLSNGRLELRSPRARRIPPLPVPLRMHRAAGTRPPRCS
jgi:hypothetical protein